MIGNVFEFHQRFSLPLGSENQMDDEAERFRLQFLNEELEELEEALAEKDVVKAFDALLDLVYVAQGTALFLGIDPAQWDAGMRAVHNANMAKVRAGSAQDSKRGTALDVVKSEGWEGPESRLQEILDWDLPKRQGELNLWGK